MIKFWNGNKSAARQSYERALLQRCLAITAQEYGDEALSVDDIDLPLAEQEGDVFNQGTDILVTVAGNAKFAGKEKLIIKEDISKGLLGYRVLLFNKALTHHFSSISMMADLQHRVIGVPNTWVDAQLFRANGFMVNEKGLFEELFPLLQSHDFEYTALGANEVLQICEDMKASDYDVVIDQTCLLYYPYPIVFYVNPARPELARRVSKGLALLKANGGFDQLFNEHHLAIIEQLKLSNRQVFSLTNPALPSYFAGFSPELTF